jgi:AraC-like DNA-binding protein
MTSVADDFRSHRFSTDDLPERDRVAIWREEFGRRMLQADFEVLPGARFYHTTTFRRMPGLALGFSAAAGFRGTRGRQLLGDGSDDLLLTINTEGVDRLAQFGRETRAGPGDGVMMSCAEWAQFIVPEPVRFILVAVPRRPIATMVKDPEAAAGRLLHKDMESLRLLTGYMSIADECITSANRELQHLFVRHVYDLMALTFGATADATETAQRRGLRVARLKAIKADIRSHLGARDLALNTVAKRQGISPIYIRKLFDGESTSFTQFVLDERLARAHQLLSDPRFAGRGIGALALESGFGDLSYFNRAFRRRFGTSPSDVRAAATGSS